MEVGRGKLELEEGRDGVLMDSLVVSLNSNWWRKECIRNSKWVVMFMSLNVPLIIHSINKYLQSSYYVPNSELSASNLTVSKTNKAPERETSEQNNFMV